MDFFERLGNFLTLGGWSSNQERQRADEERKKREAEEAERRRQEEAARKAAEAAKPKPTTPSIMGVPTVPVAQKNNTQPLQNTETAPKPPQTAPRATTNKNPLGLGKTQTTLPDALTVKNPLSQGNQDWNKLVGGVSPEDKKTIEGFMRKGKTAAELQPLITAMRQNRKATQQAEFQNSVPGKIINTIGDVGRTLVLDVPAQIAGTALDIGTQGAAAMDWIRNIGNPEAQRRSAMNAQEVRKWLQSNLKDTRGNPIVKDDWKAGEWWDLAGRSIMVGLDLGTLGRAKPIAEGVEDATQSVIRAFELTAGRRATAEERLLLEKQVVEGAKKAKRVPDDTVLEPKTPTPPGATPKPSAPDAPEAQTVAKKYQETVNAIRADGNLTTAQRQEAERIAKERSIQALKALDTRAEDSVQAQAQVVDDVAQVEAERVAQQADAIAEVQARQAEAVAPAPGQIVQEAPIAPEVSANNAYDILSEAPVDQVAARRASADAVREAQQINPLEKLWNRTKEAVADPLAVSQKLSNQYYNSLKKSGLIREGQRELKGNEDIAQLTRLSSSPETAVRDLLKDTGIDAVIKDVAKRGKDYTNDFEDYRLFRDQLWRILNGEPNTLSVEPSAMAKFVRQMDADHPEMARNSDLLRQFNLENMRRRVEAGIDSREMFENSIKNPFYTPRRQVVVEDQVRPDIRNVFNRTAKTTRSRTDKVGDVESPLEMFEIDARNTIRGEAVQQRSQILRDMGFEVSDSAEAGAVRRDTIKIMRQMSDIIDETKASLAGVRGARKVNRAQLAGLQRQLAETMRGYLKGESVNEAAIRQANKMTREELLDLYRYTTELDPAVTIGTGAKAANKGIAKRAALDDELTMAVEDLRTTIQEGRGINSDLWATIQELPRKNPRTGMTEVTYKYDGVTGRIEIPSELADEWARFDATFDRSPVGRFVDALGGAAKVTWTGILAPVYQLKQVMMNTGLMFRNADGLSGVNPEALMRFFKSTFAGGGDFRRQLVARGGQYENATKGIVLRRAITDDLVDQASLKNFFVRNPARTLSDFARSINKGLAHVSNAQRDAVAAGALARAKRLGFSEEEAIQLAADAPAKVFGDFNRVSQLARNLDSTVLPYSGAIQAGARAMLRASKTKPLETATKDAIIVSSLGGIIGWNMYNGADKYYKAMEESGQQFDMENNIVIATGSVSQNADGTWNNLIKIPLTPDFRPAQRAIIDVANKFGDEQGDPIMVGSELFNYFTGDVSNSIFNPAKTDDGRDTFGGILSGSPILSTLRILGNRDIYSGGEYLDDSMTALDKDKQVFETTSDAAKAFSQLMGGAISPIQADQFLGQFGGTGRAVKAVGDDQANPLGEIFDPSGVFVPRKAASEETLSNRAYFDNVDEVAREFRNNGGDQATYNAFMALHSKKGDINKSNMLNNANKMSQYMLYSGDGSFKTSPLFEMERALDAAQVAQGKPGNPIFKLEPQALQKVLTYRSLKIANAAGQSYSKGGEAAFVALGLDDKWYQDFREAENSYYNQVMGDKDDEYKTFSGKPSPRPSPELQKKLDVYYTLPKGTGDRSAFLKANPDVLDHWAKDNEFTNEERKALGFSVENFEEGYGSGGGKGSWSPYGLAGEITNAGNSVSRFKPVSDDPYEALSADLAAQLRSLMASRRGGRSNIALGASSRGDLS